MALVDVILTSTVTEEVRQAYDAFFLSAEAVGDLLRRPPEDISTFIKKAAVVPATGFTTTMIARRLQRLADVVFVAPSFTDYNKPFVYSLALAAELDPGSDPTVVALSEKQAEVAFALARCWSSSSSSPTADAAAGGPRPAAPGAGSVAEGGAASMDADEEEEENEEARPLAWEEQPEPLPEDLRQVLIRHTQGVLSLDPRSIMESLPVWDGIKQKAEQNNYRQDAQHQLDRCLRAVQQKVLGLHRAYPALHQGVDEETQPLGQQFWGLLLQLEDFVLSQRKQHSIPGSIAKSEPQLFTQEDIKLSMEQSKINKANSYRPGQKGSSPAPSLQKAKPSLSASTGAPRGPTPCLLFPTGKGFKYRSKGYQPWRWTGSTWAGRGRSKGGKASKGGKGTALYPGGVSPGKGIHSDPCAYGGHGTHCGPVIGKALSGFRQSDCRSSTSDFSFASRSHFCPPQAISYPLWRF